MVGNYLENQERIILGGGDSVYGVYLEGLLSSDGYEVVSVSRGTEVLAIAERQPVSMFVLSNLLADMEAFSLVKKLRETVEGTRIPVMVLLSMPDSALAVQHYKAGADAVLVKPVRCREFLATIRAMFRYRDSWKDKAAQELKALSKRLYEQLDERQANMEDQIKRGLYKEIIYSITRGHLLMLANDEFARYSEVVCKYTDSVELDCPRAVSRARMLVSKCARDWGFSEDVCDDLMLCVSEAGTNAVKHGGGGTMNIGFTEENGNLYICTQDHGPGINEAFLVDALFCAGASAKKSFGFGFSIIMDLVDSVVMTTSTNGTGVLLCKNRQQRQVDHVMDEVLTRF